MKTICSLFISFLITAAGLASAQEYGSLSGARDTVTVEEGQTVMIVAATEQTILEVKPRGRRPQQFEFYRPRHGVVVSGRSQRLRLPVPTLSNPTPIAGPVTLTLRSDGLITFSIAEPIRRGFLSSGTGPRAYARK
ncbi:MAG: hypothetical protein Q7Q71_14655 [Verrucomicrobiota bacterium JB023]|nr:hypothetical protein [Verrucomicrobiota bacterium JB023]